MPIVNQSLRLFLRRANALFAQIQLNHVQGIFLGAGIGALFWWATYQLVAIAFRVLF